jgi:ABC-2 type transport system permease protein
MAIPASLVRSETRVQTRIFFRTPIAAFFTLAFPVFFLVLINLLNSGATIDSMGGISLAQFTTPGIAVFGMVTATFTNLAINTANARDTGVLKRVLSTPVPMPAHLSGRLLSAVFVGLISVVLMLAIGAVAFGVEIPWSDLPLIVLLMALGAATFSALGLAVAGITPNARSAPAVANAFILPLAFISGIFFPMEGAPEWLATIAGLFPLQPFASAMVDIFNPTLDSPFPWRAIAVMTIWLVIGIVIAIRSFSWEPREGGGLRSSD